MVCEMSWVRQQRYRDLRYFSPPHPEGEHVGRSESVCSVDCLTHKRRIHQWHAGQDA